MSRKAFLVQVELDVQAVTCPGVWLCSNGKVSLQMYMLDSCVQTESYKPLFPIQCNETFVFYKTFYNKHRLKDLEDELHDEWIYVELVQWQSCEIGYVLASFQTTLDELLYPSTRSGSIAGVDLDLLMEAKKSFPGTIAPKIEISTRTTIEETLCVCKKPASSTVIVNPKVLSSQRTKHCKGKMARKVCHSIAYSRRKPHFKNYKSRPPFRYRKAEDDLILRKPQPLPESSPSKHHQHNCRKLKKSHLFEEKCRKSRTQTGNECPCSAVRMCSCGSGHRVNACPVCSKYKGYFTASEASEEPIQREPSPMRTTLFDADRFSHQFFQQPNQCLCCRPVAFTTNKSTERTKSELSTEESVDCCYSCCPKRPSLAEKLHDKLKKTLSAAPTELSCPCNEDIDESYETCNCRNSSRRVSKELYNDLQKFYGDLYKKARSNMSACIPDCPGGCR